MQFSIAGSGEADAAGGQDSTLSDEKAVQRITAAVARWTIPAPEGGGSVLVTTRSCSSPAEH